MPQEFFAVILVAAGGAAGALTRFLVSSAFKLYLPVLLIPLDIMLINTIGSFSIGFIGSFLATKGLTLGLKQFINIGFLGSFTTFSSFSEEAYLLGMKSQFISALYMAVSIASGVLACYFGHYLALKLLR